MTNPTIRIMITHTLLYYHSIFGDQEMSVRVQVILDEEEVAMFRQHAKKEAVSLSRWLRESGRIRLENENRKRSLKDLERLKEFFRECDEIDQDGREPDWSEHKKLIAEGYSRGTRA